MVQIKLKIAWIQKLNNTNEIIEFIMLLKSGRYTGQSVINVFLTGRLDFEAC